VQFDMDEPPADWQKSVPVKFTFAAANKKRKDGRWIFKLNIFYFPVDKESRYGKFVVKTNHPDKPDFKISGVLDPRK
jgi:hypothetical protein